MDEHYDVNQSINFNLNSHKHFYSVEKKKLNTFKYIQSTYRRWEIVVMKYLQLSLKSEVLKGKEKEQTVLIEGWLWRVWDT